jgi:hypothetical protein
MTTETKENVSEENVQTQASQQPSADLNISDLVAIKSIIEIASQRGAFKAAELEAVGKTFNKLNNFLETVSKKES